MPSSVISTLAGLRSLWTITGCRYAIAALISRAVVSMSLSVLIRLWGVGPYSASYSDPRVHSSVTMHLCPGSRHAALKRTMWEQSSLHTRRARSQASEAHSQPSEKVRAPMISPADAVIHACRSHR